MANTPTFILYHGRNTGNDKDSKKIWTRIGAAWPNKSGKGFNLTWDYLPLGDDRADIYGASLLLRTPLACETGAHQKLGAEAVGTLLPCQAASDTGEGCSLTEK
jgi:hypothetical protein